MNVKGLLARKVRHSKLATRKCQPEALLGGPGTTITGMVIGVLRCVCVCVCDYQKSKNISSLNASLALKIDMYIYICIFMISMSSSQGLRFMEGAQDFQININTLITLKFRNLETKKDHNK